MSVRSLSLPPPHPLVLTGKGRSFLQPKLPTLPLRPSPLSVCALCFPYYSNSEGLCCFHSIFLWWLVAFWFLWSCGVSWVGWGTPLSFISCVGIVYWLFFFLLRSSAWCRASLTLVMGIYSCFPLYSVHTFTGFHHICMNFPLT